MCAELHPPDGVDEIHPRVGAPVFKCWTGGSLLGCSGIFGSQRAALLLYALPDPQRCCELLFFFNFCVCVCMCVGNLNDFRLENAEGIKPVKHCVLLQHLQFANYISGFLSQSLFCTAALL